MTTLGQITWEEEVEEMMRRKRTKDWAGVYEVALTLAMKARKIAIAKGQMTPGRLFPEEQSDE